jgi:sulfotransferase family protein
MTTDSIDRKPTFLIVGAMRSGTTTLARSLGSHPEVYMASEKEVHFFDLHHRSGMEWYATRFAGASGERQIGEATTYMHDEQPRRRMAAALPDARLIVVLRDPVSRAYSHYWLNRANGIERLGFEEAIAAEPKRLATLDEIAARRFAYARAGRYLEQLLDLCRFYPREAMFVMLLDDLRSDARTVYRRMCRFLEIDDHFVAPEVGRTLNAHTSFRSPALRRITKPLPRVVRRPIGRLNARRTGYPPMEDAVRAQLEARFAQGNASLASWLGRDLSLWGSDLGSGDQTQDARSA